MWPEEVSAAWLWWILCAEQEAPSETKWRSEGASGRDFPNGRREKRPSLPRWRRARVPLSVGSYPRSWSPNTARFSGAGCRAQQQKAQAGRSACCRRAAGPAGASPSKGCSCWAASCSRLRSLPTGAPRRGAVPGTRGWHGTALRGTRALARHSTEQSSTQGCTAHPAAPQPCPGPLAAPTGTYPALVRGATVLPWVPAAFYARIHPHFTETLVTSSLIAPRCAKRSCEHTLLCSPNVHLLRYPHQGSRDPSPFAIPHAPASPHTYKPCLTTYACRLSPSTPKGDSDMSFSPFQPQLKQCTGTCHVTHCWHFNWSQTQLFHITFPIWNVIWS